jgi:hypothetical protein
VKVELRSDALTVGTEQQVYAERAARLTLGRFGPRISQIWISVGPGGSPPADDPGAVAAADRQVAVRLDGKCRLLVLETDRTFESALIRALDRARRYLEREPARGVVRRRADARRPGTGLAAFAGSAVR